MGSETPTPTVKKPGDIIGILAMYGDVIGTMALLDKNGLV
jgi:hypothetical protein